MPAPLHGGVHERRMALMTTPTAGAVPEPVVARTLRVVVVDDQMPFRVALRRVLQRAPGIDVVGEGADGSEAIALVEEVNPDVVVLDVRMPGMDGPTAARRSPSDGRRWLSCSARATAAMTCPSISPRRSSRRSC